MTVTTESRSESLYGEAVKVMPGGSSRATIFFPPYPIYARSGQGCVVTDMDGVERIDFVNNMSSLIHGHNHPAVNQAVKEQLDRITAVAMPTESEIILAQELCRRVPSAERVIFTNSGTEAVMMAVRAARAYTGRTAIAKAEGAYHGAYEPMEISVSPERKSRGDASAPNAVPDSEGIPGYVTEDVIIFPFNDLDATEKLITRNRHRLACVVLDPMVSRAGLIRARPEYIAGLREMTSAYGILLVFDEVFSFRLGFNGAQGQYGITPDLTALGKIIGGGFPVGAVCGAAEIMSVFDASIEHGKIHHGGTYNANPITMTAGLKTLELLEPGVFERMEQLGRYTKSVLTEALHTARIDGFARTEGSLVALFFGGEDSDRYRELPSSQRQTAMWRFLHRNFLDNGVICTPFAGFVLSTPMTEREIDKLGDVAARGFARLKREFG